MNSKQIISCLREKGYCFPGNYHPFANSVQDYLKRHDIVFQSPQKGGFEGLPLGNGDLSAMVWTTDREILIQLNKNNLWTQPDEESPMLLRSCGQVRISFDTPCFDWLYLESFEARLSLGRERVTIHAQTPFRQIQAEIWIDPDENILLAEINCQDDQGVNKPFRIQLERFGSRSFSHWYSGIQQGAWTGLGKSSVHSDSTGILLTEPFTEKDQIALAIRAEISGCRTEFSGQDHYSDWIFCLPDHSSVNLAVGVSVQKTLIEAQKEVVSITSAAKTDGNNRKIRRNSWWKEFWDRSFLSLSPDGQNQELDYLENLYYVQIYALGCASRGDYPMIFNGGGFTWNHDVRQWVNPHHWNIQQSYWAVEAMNRPELMKPYLKTYFRMIPAAKEYAKASRGVKHGLIISEMHDFSGRMLAYKGALTPASQIAQQFWNHYLYSGDLHYLEETGYPFIRECADFYTDYATFDEKTQKYIIGPAACCECTFGENFWNTSVDLAMTRYILPIAIRASKLLQKDEHRRTKWEHLLQNLPDFVYWEDHHPETLAVALDKDGQKVDFEEQNRTFCRNTSPIMPCAIIGSRQKGTRLYQAVRNAAAEYSRSALAITPISTIWARFGEGNKALSFLLYAIEQLQHFPQGFYYNIDHWYQYSRYAKKIPDYLTECQRDYIYDESLVYPNIPITGTNQRRDLPMRPFAQAGFETPGILTLTLQEMFLQSYEEVLRVGPALPSGITGKFTLKAAGAFLVTGFSEHGMLLPLAFLYSQNGQPCRLEPWFPIEEMNLCSQDGQEIPFTVSQEGDLLFTIPKGETAILWSNQIEASCIPSAQLVIQENQSEKRYHQARLGSAISY